jgi:DNA-binding NarL/FixJ family response regulator
MQAPNFTPSVLEELTRQETKILELVAEGLTNQEIASRLFIDETTVKTHRHNITRKANVKGTSEIRKFVKAITPFLKNTTFLLLFYYLSSIAVDL